MPFDTRPRRGRTIARVAWGVTALVALGLFALSLPGYLRPDLLNSPMEAAPAWASIIGYINALGSMAVVLVSLGLAGLLVWRRSHDRMALFTSFFLLAYAIVMAGPLELVPLTQPALA